MATTGFILLGSPDADHRIVLPDGLSVNDPLGSTGRPAAADTNGLQLGHKFGHGQQIGVGPNGRPLKSWSNPAQITRIPRSAKRWQT